MPSWGPMLRCFGGLGKRFWGGGMLMGPLVWLIIIGLGIYILRGKTTESKQDNRQLNNSPIEKRESALEIARRRYAAGELTNEEFQEMKQELQSENDNF